VPIRVINPNATSFIYKSIPIPTAMATTPVKSLPAVRPRAPLVLPWVLPVEEGRVELEVELLGGEEETEET